MRRVHVHIDRLVLPASPRGQMIVRAVERALPTGLAASNGGPIASAVAQAVGRAQSSSRRETRPTPFSTGGNVRGGKAT